MIFIIFGATSVARVCVRGCQDVTTMGTNCCIPRARRWAGFSVCDSGTGGIQLSGFESVVLCLLLLIIITAVTGLRLSRQLAPLSNPRC